MDEVQEKLKTAQSMVDERTRCKTDKLYLAEVLGYDFQWETHAELFANFIKYDSKKPWAQQSDTKNIMVLWSRGHYKTTAIVVEIIQAIINFPNVRILLMQGSLPTTKTLLKQVLSHFTGEAYNSRFSQLFPDFCGTQEEGGEWKFGKKVLNANESRFTTPARIEKQLAQATVTVASPNSLKTGQHYDIGFFDDLVNEKNYKSQTQIEKVKEQFVGCRPLINPGGYRIVTGTRYTHGDLYEWIKKWDSTNGNWTVSIKGCWTDQTKNLPDEQKVPRFPQYTMRNGELGGFTTEMLLGFQEDDVAAFANQYLNEPIHTSKQVFTEAILHAAKIPMKDAPPLSAPILVIDLASTTNEKSDDSVIQIGRVDSLGIGYLCDQDGGQWEHMDIAMHVIAKVIEHHPTRILLENSAAGQIFKTFLEHVARMKKVFIQVDLIKVDNKDDAKNTRVGTFGGFVKRGQFKFLMGLPKFDKLVEQAITFPKGRHGHDDYIDTAALLQQELVKETTARPMRQVHSHPIFAMIADREAADAASYIEQSQLEVIRPDFTGME